MIKQQEGAWGDRAYQSNSGIVGSRPDLFRWARGLEKLQRTDEYEVLRDSVVTEYQGVLASASVGSRPEVVRWARGLECRG